MRQISYILFLILMASPGAMASRAANVSSGTLEKFNDFPSQFVSARDVQVWLPDDYSSNRKYSVLYMHDGQMLFDAQVTWNKQEWGVDEIAQSLINEGKIKNFIVVGVFNDGQSRHSDYLPEKPYHMLDNATKERFYGVEASILKADEYITFLAEELKPFIDNRYSVYTDAKNTAIAGSSMGGLISMYALVERPDVFGSAACISTHWPGFDPGSIEEMPGIFIAYMRKNLPQAGIHKIYFDHGDQTLDRHYPPLQKKVDEMMVGLGYDQSNWMTVVDPGAAHDEKAWKSRLPGILNFLFGKAIDQ